MSGLPGLRLQMLLFSCVSLWLAGQAGGALVISRDKAAEQQGKESAVKSMQKRNVAPDTNVELSTVTVVCTVTSRFAHTVMTTTAHNLAETSQEVHFDVELPKTAFISNFSMEIGSRVYVGEVKEKQQAQQQYDDAVSSGESAGLVKASGRSMESFSVSVNIAGQSGVTFVLTYEELLHRKNGQYEIVTRVNPRQLVQDFKILTYIYEPSGIAFVDAYATFLTEAQLPLVETVATVNKAQISFTPSTNEQILCANQGNSMDGHFIVRYDVRRSHILGEVQIINGYFVHFFAPPDLQRVPKNVAFVIDRSGSMSGTKMQQTKEALLAIIQDLDVGDHFALISFDHSISMWRDHFSKATAENVAAALAYIPTIYDFGTTNINGALLTAVNMLIGDREGGLLPATSADMIILLTDGMPTHGVTDTAQIQQNVRNAIDGRISLFCLGFGNNVDYSFLNVMAQQNKGVARRIYEASDATLQLQGFYDEISSPLLLEVDIIYADSEVDISTTNHFNQLFNGTELIVAGHLTQTNIHHLNVEVNAIAHEANFSEVAQVCALDWSVVYPNEAHIFGDYIERLWAYLTIQQLFEQSKSSTPEEAETVIARVLAMSLQYNFVTPVTSMVVTRPPQLGEPCTFLADKLTEEERQEAERAGFTTSPTGPTYLVDGDPHFIIELPQREDALCFNINEKPGTIFNLVTDAKPGILVNGEIIGDKEIPPDGTMNSYFWRFGIIHKTLGVKLEVTTEYISVFQDLKWFKLLWSDSASLKTPNMDLLLTKDRSLLVTLKNSVKFLILLHKVWEKHPYHRTYLGFYTLDSHLLSSSVHGLLGQFYHGLEYEVTDLRPGEAPEKPDATMHVKGQELVVTRGWQRDFRRDVKNGENIPCWFVHSNGTGLIDGEVTDYMVSGLFKTASQ